MHIPDSNRLPPYFQATAHGGTLSVRIPTDLIDVFYLRHSRSGATERVAVLRCLGGAIDVVAGATIASLPPDLQAQLMTTEINQRHVFRTITADELHIFALDAVEQEAQARGFNDAVDLQGRLHAQVGFNLERVEARPLAQAGRLTVGRLDVLHGFLAGSAAAFANPRAGDERAYHLLVPGAPTPAITHGRGLVLAYPILDPATFTSIDTTFVAMRIAYDLLLRLQQDFVQSGSRHPFATAILPVPSRHRLESELEADGYEICGDEAIKRSDGAAQNSADQATFLGRLRRIAQQWTAPRIVLPPQATPPAYAAIIDDVIHAAAMPADLQMVQALDERVTFRATPGAQTPPPNVVPQPRQPPLPPPLPQPYTGVTQPLNPQAAQSRSADWASDFAASPAPTRPRQLAVRPTRSTPAPDTCTSSEDWTLDFLAEQRPPQGTTEQPQRAVEPANEDWAQDFRATDGERRTNANEDWADDFK